LEFEEFVLPEQTIAAGDFHTCAVTPQGGLKCWGQNENGQLGDGTQQDSLVPKQVAGLSKDVDQVVAGGSHTCAMKQDGSLVCWGRNNFGQVGDGSVEDALTPTQVSGIESRVIGVSAGTWHACALIEVEHAPSDSDPDPDSDQQPEPVGKVMCWGENGFGRLGDGTTDRKTVPIDVAGLDSDILAVVAGGSHTCVITSKRGVKCWGLNGKGQLGEGSTTNRMAPTQVKGLESGVLALAAGNQHTCALKIGGAMLCWGANDQGQLGNGGFMNQWAPTAVVGFELPIIRMAVGEFRTCAIDEAGVTYCWGNERYGELDGDALTSTNTPQRIDGVDVGAKDASIGSAHTCVRLANDELETLRCWGKNRYGALGDGTTEERWEPVDVVGFQ